MSDVSKLVRAVKRASLEAAEAGKPAAVMSGIVQSVNPLSVVVEQRLTLTSEFLRLSRSVTDYETEISFADPAVKQEYTTWDMAETRESAPAKISFKQPVKHRITVHNALKAGERVLLLRIQGGKEFLIVDRLGG